jgi:hypothetical protein
MNHVKDVMMEPDLMTVFGEPIMKMEGLSKCWDGRCSPSECHLTNTNLSVDPRQAQEHFSPMVCECLLSGPVYISLMH